MSRRLKYATFCSGIECMSVACRGLPLDPVFFSEIEPFPCAVLRAHYPSIPNLGDMSKIRRDEKGDITNGRTTIPFPDGGIDILAAGCPCQDFSVAGKRAGGEEGSGTRSSLIFEFIRIVGEVQPRWFIYENVVGMLSTNEGRDFAHILLAFRDCGYSVCWRTLDAQYVRVDGMERAVPQRRRRVWVVGCAGADESVPAQILFESDCVAGHTPPSRRAGQGFAYSLARRDRVDAGVVGDATTRGTGGGIDAIALDGDKLKPRVDQRKGGNGFGINEDGAGYTLTGVDRHGVAYGMDARNTGLYGAGATGEEVSMTQDANQCKGGKCVVLCADGGDVASTITRQISEQSGQDNRANAVVQIASGVSFDGRKDAPIADGVAHSQTIGTNPGFKDGVVVSMAQNTRDEVRIIGGDGQIAGALPAEPGMKQQTYVVSTKSTAYKLDSTASNSMKSANPNSGFHETQVAACLDTTTPDPSKGQGGNVIISTNSNGEDVAATINANMSKLGGDNQTTFGGGYCITRREEGAHDEPQL